MKDIGGDHIPDLFAFFAFPSNKTTSLCHIVHHLFTIILRLLAKLYFSNVHLNIYSYMHFLSLFLGILDKIQNPPLSSSMCFLRLK